VEVVICCGEMVFDKPIKVCKRKYKENEWFKNIYN
jgi:hypothetical protein